MTAYLVLRKSLAFGKDKIDEGGWTIAGNIEASSAAAAVRAHLNGADEGGEFVAVPARSWQPVKVSIEKAVKFT